MFSSYFINMCIRPRSHVSRYFLKSDIFSPSSERHTKNENRKWSPEWLSVFKCTDENGVF